MCTFEDPLALPKRPALLVHRGMDHARQEQPNSTQSCDVVRPVPLSFAPGGAYQFGWSHEVVLLSGVTVIVKITHIRLCHSRMPFVRAYPRETQGRQGTCEFHGCRIGSVQRPMSFALALLQ